MLTIFLPLKGGLADDSEGGAVGSGGDVEIVGEHGEVQSAVLRDTIKGVPLDMASFTGRFLDELDANAAAAVSCRLFPSCLMW